MVIEKLDALESAVRKVLDELTVLRRSREELEAQLDQVRAEARSAADSIRAREQEVERLREENHRIQKEHADVRDRVERILSHIPGD